MGDRVKYISPLNLIEGYTGVISKELNTARNISHITFDDNYLSNGKISNEMWVLDAFLELENPRPNHPHTKIFQ